MHRLSYHINPKIWLGIKWLATYIAIRPGELVEICEEDLDLSLGLFILRHTKEGRDKFVQMLPEDIELVKSLPRGFPKMPFFRHEKGVRGRRLDEPFSHKYFYRWWKKACENLGIEGVDLYGGSRHSTATALRKHLSPEQIKAGTMHSTNKAFDRYLQIQSGDALDVYRMANSMTRAGQPVANQNQSSDMSNLLKFKE